MKHKTALIIGITGQDGYYLAHLLKQKNYAVHGLCRRVSTDNNTIRLHTLLNDGGITLHPGDLLEPIALVRLLHTLQPDEIYNLGAQSHVGISFENPSLTAQIDALGTLHVLEAIRTADLLKKTRFYQAGSSEMFGNPQTTTQNEETPFSPVSPYGAAKVYAHHITTTYRQAYGLFACNGILFNHESPWRGENFVTRKITIGAARIASGQQDVLLLGNLDALRDWGHARDYVHAMWAMLQQAEPDDYVIATGRTATVRDFATLAFRYAGMDLEWEGGGANEIGRERKTGTVRVKVDPALLRPTDVHTLCGNSQKAQQKLGWNPHQTSLDDLVHEMLEADMKRIREAA
ncbi:MAG: GDP-mannose 4,6-dehydratase [Alphaproteobacteria bacterium]|nr:GDP-mannose 4,6-dehydratase [Alphaproteobacteria bacterium]